MLPNANRTICVKYDIITYVNVPARFFSSLCTISYDQLFSHVHYNNKCRQIMVVISQVFTKGKKSFCFVQ